MEMVARVLQDRGARVFYDRDEVKTLWGKDLVEHFDHIYRSASVCVMFISEAYASKAWTRHERRSALARALVEEDQDVLPARFDDTELPGLPPTIGYVDLRQYAPATLADFVLGKLGLRDPYTPRFFVPRPPMMRSLRRNLGHRERQDRPASSSPTTASPPASSSARSATGPARCWSRRAPELRPASAGRRCGAAGVYLVVGPDPGRAARAAGLHRRGRQRAHAAAAPELEPCDSHAHLGCAGQKSDADHERPALGLAHDGHQDCQPDEGCHESQERHRPRHQLHEPHSARWYSHGRTEGRTRCCLDADSL